MKTLIGDEHLKEVVVRVKWLVDRREKGSKVTLFDAGVLALGIERLIAERDDCKEACASAGVTLKMQQEALQATAARVQELTSAIIRRDPTFDLEKLRWTDEHQGKQ